MPDRGTSSGAGDPPANLARAARELITSISGARTSARRRTAAVATLRELSRQLEEAAYGLDLIKRPPFVFEPSDPRIAGRIIGISLAAQPRHGLADFQPFYGSGVYALYYSGPHPAYSLIAGTEAPIYVGKADPSPGAPGAKSAFEQGPRLAARLREHGKKIVIADNLDIADFEFRALVVQTGYQSAAEDYLIRLFAPPWNKEMRICYGFGKHGDKAETRANLRSPWDILHPGRKWAARSQSGPRAAAVIAREVQAHLHRHHVPKTLDDILHCFLADISAGSRVGATSPLTAP